MSTIELSAEFSSGLASRMFGIANNSGSVSYASIPFLGGQGSVYYWVSAVRSTIFIYKGTIPSSGVINWSGQAANILVAYQPVNGASSSVYTANSGNSYNTTTCVYSNNSVNINTTYVPAYASGTATWFALVGTAGGSGTAGLTGQSIYGNIGLQGSGQDLEMATTTIVTGSYYRIQNLRITIPTSWTY